MRTLTEMIAEARALKRTSPDVTPEAVDVFARRYERLVVALLAHIEQQWIDADIDAIAAALADTAQVTQNLEARCGQLVAQNALLQRDLRAAEEEIGRLLEALRKAMNEKRIAEEADRRLRMVLNAGHIGRKSMVAKARAENRGATGKGEADL